MKLYMLKSGAIIPSHSCNIGSGRMPSRSRAPKKRRMRAAQHRRGGGMITRAWQSARGYHSPHSLYHAQSTAGKRKRAHISTQGSRCPSKTSSPVRCVAASLHHFSHAKAPGQCQALSRKLIYILRRSAIVPVAVYVTIIHHRRGGFRGESRQALQWLPYGVLSHNLLSNASHLQPPSTLTQKGSDRKAHR